MTAQIQPEEDLTGVSYIFHQWLQINGPLKKENVLEYFAESPFYDHNCNNEVCKKQNIPPEQIESVMKEMKGTEYVLVYSQENPSLFVIQRQIREGPNKVIPTGLYYVIDNTVYQSPTLLSLLQSRVFGSLIYLHNSFREVSQFFDFDPMNNYKWSEEIAKLLTSEQKSSDLIVRGNLNSFDQILRSLHEKYMVQQSKVPPPKAPQTRTEPRKEFDK